MTTSEIRTAVLPNGPHGNGEWLQVTPGERFKIRTSVEETEEAFATLELVAEFRNGTPMLLVFSSEHIERLFREVAARENDDIAAILDKFDVLIVGPALLEGAYAISSSRDMTLSTGRLRQFAGDNHDN